MNISESLSEMFLLLIESLYKPDVVMNESVENLLVMMRLAHIYDAESTLKTCQKLLGSADLTVEICDRALNMQEHERYFLIIIIMIIVIIITVIESRSSSASNQELY